MKNLFLVEYEKIIIFDRTSVHFKYLLCMAEMDFLIPLTILIVLIILKQQQQKDYCGHIS